MDKSITKVLCKRTLTSGKPFWWDDEGSVSPPDHPKRHQCENRSFIEGTWYEITKWSDDGKWFWVTDSEGNPHANCVYTQEEKDSFPDYCDLHGPRDYAKWFYTPEELLQVEAGTHNPSYKEKNAICVLPGNYHWVKLKEEDGGKWIIAEASRKHEVHGKHYWKTFGHVGEDKTDFDFADIGEMVESREQQIRNQKRIENLEELNDTIFPLVDSLEAEGTDDAKWKAPAEYHKPLILEAAKSYIKKTWDELADPDLFFGE